MKYRTGKTLGSGTYAIVKEAIHVETGKYFACKVINKKLMEGREHMVCVSIVSSSLLPFFCFFNPIAIDLSILCVYLFGLFYLGPQ